MGQLRGGGGRVRGGRDLQQVLIDVPGERVPCPYWGTRGAAWCMGYQAARIGVGEERNPWRSEGERPNGELAAVWCEGYRSVDNAANEGSGA